VLTYTGLSLPDLLMRDACIQRVNADIRRERGSKRDRETDGEGTKNRAVVEMSERETWNCGGIERGHR
jgi:hypothetical protein